MADPKNRISQSAPQPMAKPKTDKGKAGQAKAAPAESLASPRKGANKGKAKNATIKDQTPTQSPAERLAATHARPRGASEIFASQPFPLKRHKSPYGQVTAVSMMKDEGPYVIEWVAHHLALGFSDLVVYTNDCTDGTDEMLIRLEELGLAHHRRNDIPEGIRPQPSALNYAQAEPVVTQSDWVMVFDADEFLSIRYGDGTLDDLIGAAVAQEANGIVITWRIFGSGGVVDWSRAPVTEQYLKAAPPEWNKGWGVKTLFKFDPDYWKLGIHRPKMKSKWLKTDFPDQVKWLNGAGREMPDYFKFRGWRSIVRTIGYDWVQLNHYAVKSVESYALRKLRGNVNNKKDKYNSDYWSLQDRNEVEDRTMLRYSEKRERIIAELLKDPVLARLHYAALERVEARLHEVRQSDAYRDLVTDLATASRVPIHQIIAKPPQARDPAKIAALMSEVEKSRNAKAKAARQAEPQPPPGPSVPLSPFAAQPMPSPDFTGEWHENHAILLPADAGIFAPSALSLIRQGKYDRGLARRLPALLRRQAKLLEIGANIGFLQAHLAHTRPDLALVAQETDPGLAAAMDRVFFQNHEKLPHPPQRLAPPLQPEAMVEVFAEISPDILLLSDPLVSPEIFGAMLAKHRPAQICLYGRLTHEKRTTLWDYAQHVEKSHHLSGNFDPNLILFWQEGAEQNTSELARPDQSRTAPSVCAPVADPKGDNFTAPP